MKRVIPEKLNLEQLATFELVVLHGSFSAAAEQLGLTQPAVSLQIRQLEKFFNLKLLERIAKKNETDFGRDHAAGTGCAD